MDRWREVARMAIVGALMAVMASWDGRAGQETPPTPVRVATFNVSMARDQAGQLALELDGGDHPSIHRVAAILRLVRPDVVLLNEFDHDGAHADRLIQQFQDNYLAAERGAEAGPPLRYAHTFTAPVNTGVPSGLDLDGDGTAGVGGGDAYGFGLHPGQYGMVVLSRFPIVVDKVRTFQHLRWGAMPGALLPDDPRTDTPADFLAADAQNVMRLPSKSLWDLPIHIGDHVVHLLASHPTPPAFDGPEDRNGRRNHDEIRLLADYITGGPGSAYISDQHGVHGGLAPAASFVIVGDLNADPDDGDSVDRAIRQLLDHSRIQSSVAPTSDGAVAAAQRDGGVNSQHRGPDGTDTADFSERGPGNLRTDYVLPSRDLRVVGSGVFWPKPGDPGAELVDASDHRLVWLDLVPGPAVPGPGPADGF